MSRDPFGLGDSDPETLLSGRIPDPQPAHTPLFRLLARVFAAAEARLRARGGKGLRVGIRALWLLVAIVGLFLLFGPVLNKPLDFDDVLDSADIDEVDWIARDVRLDYRVGRDDADRFVTEVSEEYTASFVNDPEPRIERAFATEFRGRDTRFELISATIDGEPAVVETHRGPATTKVSIARSDGSQFTGEQHVEMRYELHDLVGTENDEATGAPVERWNWPLLGPSWPQATKGIEVSLTLDPGLDEALVRQPVAYLGWLLLGDTEWLEPESSDADGVRYTITNDQTLPPHPDLDVDLRFEPGTFAEAPTTPLFWWLSWGPLIPLGLLAVLAVFSLVARRVVWADSAGDPWYVAREDPPKKLTPMEATQLLGRARHAELVDELARTPQKRRGSARDRARKPRPDQDRDRPSWLSAVARAAMRTGRPGSFWSVQRRRAAWARDDVPVERKLRWVPDSYLRDLFIWGSIALVLLQWGLLRQLSQQVILAVVWWPGLFVLVSTALVILVIVVLSRPRPLTHEGALAVQQLKGIAVFARATLLLERGPVDDRLLPYAVLFERPRYAGDRVLGLARDDSGDVGLGRSWRTSLFVSAPASIALAAAVVVLAGSIFAATLPAPYAQPRTATGLRGVESDTGQDSQVEGFDVEAELRRDDQGRAVLDVVEHDTVRFTAGGASVPQLTREWPSERFGQDLALEIERVEIDGDQVPYRTLPGERTTAIATQVSEVLDGRSEVEIAYRLRAPVVDVETDGEDMQQLRWAAWLRDWEGSFSRDVGSISSERDPVRPLRIALEIDPDLVPLIESGGWLSDDVGSAPLVLGEGSGATNRWRYEGVFSTGDLDEDSDGPSVLYDLRIGSAEKLEDGTLLAVLDADAVESRKRDAAAEQGSEDAYAVDPEIDGALEKYHLGVSGDIGAALNFAPGTFTGVDSQAFAEHRLRYWVPYVAVIGLGVLVTLASFGVCYATRRRRRFVPDASWFTVSYGAIPLAAIAQFVLEAWAIGTMAGDDALGQWATGVGIVQWIAVGLQAILVWRTRRGGDDPAPSISSPRKDMRQDT